LAHPEDRQQRREIIEGVFAGRSFYGLQWRDRRADGTPCFVYVNTYPLRDAAGKVIMGISTCIDITEQKRSEEVLRLAAQQWRETFDAMADSVSIIDTKGRIQRTNRATAKILGQPLKGLSGKVCHELFHGRKRPPKGCPLRKMLKTRQSQTEEFYLSDRRRWVSITVNPIVDSKSKITGAVHVVRDITEREQLKSQLLQSEKMSALGQLISGAAHELNNPMTGVLGYAQLLLTSPDLPEKAKQSLEKINQEAERARKIVQNLLTFARQRKPEKRRVQINEIVGRTLELRAYEMKVSDIELIKDFGADIPSLLADEHQLQQVFMNIIINAEQAMLEAHGMGRLKVTTRWDRERDVVEITFQDDGPGMAEEYLSKIFDPFFTTKPDRKGTGLGLSISYGIVQEHGGCITAVRERDGGARFTVELPVVEVQVSEIGATFPSIEKMAEVEKKRVLVVDDETSVVDLVRETLEREGYVVETAYDGRAALRKIEEDRFDGVISDCKMPGVDGVDMYLYCKQKRPYLTERFLFLTGDVVAPNSHRFIEEHKVPHLSKPFNIEDLVSSVNLLFQSEG
ncbi:MAG: PAS domain S-box protein, partial [bacterium]